MLRDIFDIYLSASSSENLGANKFNGKLARAYFDPSDKNFRWKIYMWERVRKEEGGIKSIFLVEICVALDMRSQRSWRRDFSDFLISALYLRPFLIREMRFSVQIVGWYIPRVRRNRPEWKIFCRGSFIESVADWIRKASESKFLRI